MEHCCVNEAVWPVSNSTFKCRQVHGLTLYSLKTVVKMDPQSTVSIILTIHERCISVFNPSASSSTQSHMITPRMHPFMFSSRGTPLEGVQCYCSFFLKVMLHPWPAWISWLGIAPYTKGLLVWFPVTALAQLWARAPIGLHVQPSQWCFSFSHPLPFSLFKNQ